MAPRLPQVSGDDLVRLLTGLGYSIVRQRGSHIQLQKTTTVGEHRITVPAHKILAKGTLADILSKVSLWNNMSREDLVARL